MEKQTTAVVFCSACLVRGGGALFSNFQYTYAADVTGGNVTVDPPLHPVPSAPIAGGAITDGSDGNVHTNTLTTGGTEIAGLTLYGGYTNGTGDATGNTVIVNKSMNGMNGSTTLYGGWSEQGKATNNTIILNNIGSGVIGPYSHVHLYGGGGTSSTDRISGNTLEIRGNDNGVYSINNFEKLRYRLDSTVNSGSTMFWLATGTKTFDWNDITVTGVSDWMTGSPGPKKLTLFDGYFHYGIYNYDAYLTLRNYAPVITTEGDYEIGKRAETNGVGTVTVQRIYFDAKRFQNSTDSAVDGGDIYAGISTYGNTTNHNTLTINSGGYTNARAGYTNAAKGGSDYNTLNFNGGSATNAYGGYTTGTTASSHDLANDAAAKADAKNNTVNIKGGTLNAGGKLYGGYIAPNTGLSATSTGDASGNTINIENGTFGGSTEIYGGYTNGTGKATGNTVNIGKSDGTFNAPTLSNVMLYGGGSSGSASDVVTGNTLNVNANATVRNIANFSKVNFNFTPTFNQANPLLNVVGGGATSLDWNSISYTGAAPIGSSILMQNLNNINLTGWFIVK